MCTLTDSGIDTLFANPERRSCTRRGRSGNSKSEALLALFEGVVSGALTVLAESLGVRQRRCSTLALAKAMPGRPSTLPAGPNPIGERDWRPGDVSPEEANRRSSPTSPQWQKHCTAGWPAAFEDEVRAAACRAVADEPLSLAGYPRSSWQRTCLGHPLKSWPRR